MRIVDEVVGASGSPELAFHWIVSVAKAPGLEDLSDFNYPWSNDTAPKEYKFSGLDAKLSAALSRTISGDFEKKVQTMKLEAISSGRRVTGRQLLYLVDQHFKLSETDGAIHGLEHLLSVTMKQHQLDKFVADWDLVLAGIAKKPEDSTLEALFLRQLRVCKLMNDDIREYDKLESSDPNRSYAWLKRAATRVIERRRLHTHQQQMQTHIHGSPVLPVGPWKGKGKGKGKEGKGVKGEKGKKGKERSRTHTRGRTPS